MEENFHKKKVRTTRYSESSNLVCFRDSSLRPRTRTRRRKEWTKYSIRWIKIMTTNWRSKNSGKEAKRIRESSRRCHWGESWVPRSECSRLEKPAESSEPGLWIFSGISNLCPQWNETIKPDWTRIFQTSSSSSLRGRGPQRFVWIHNNRTRDCLDRMIGVVRFNLRLLD